MIELYIGINETKWNKHPVQPGGGVCIAPVYGATEATRRENSVNIPNDCPVIQDSGAFSDGPSYRLDLPKALERQLSHSLKYGYDNQVTHRASYDLLIDEVWTNGNRHKRRWSENDAWNAVDTTVKAAEYMSKNYNKPRVQSAQGVTDKQYLECTERVLEWFDFDGDIFGLGGWCICGKIPSVMREPFDDTMSLVIPYLARRGVNRVHIWGVIDPLFLGPLLYLCDDNGLRLSTDSSGPSVRPTFGEWGYRGWKDRRYKRVPVETRGLDRARHVKACRDWLAQFRDTQFYAPPVIQPKQMCMFG